MKPFNLEEAKQGKPVCTRDGCKARILCFDKISICSTPIVALYLIDEIEGIDCCIVFSNYDLLTLPPIKDVLLYQEDPDDEDELEHYSLKAIITAKNSEIDLMYNYYPKIKKFQQMYLYTKNDLISFKTTKIIERIIKENSMPKLVGMKGIYYYEK